MMSNTRLALLLGSKAAAAATPAPPTENCGVTTVAGSCWHNSDPESHIAEFQVSAPNVTAAACICFGNCTAAPGCAHWHVRLPDEGMWTCDLRTSDVRPGASQGCTRDANPAPSPGPSPPSPGPPQPYPQPPVPAPSPPPQPVLGYKPHLIFNLVDDVGHYNMGWRGNKEARTPHLDSLVAQGLVLERHYVYKYCSPTRSAFLSGRLPVHVNMANRGPDAAGGVHLGMSTIADVLTGVGYQVYPAVHHSRL